MYTHTKKTTTAAIDPCTALTLALPKTGLASGTAGDLWLADIGIPPATFQRAGVNYIDPFGERYRVRLKSASRPAGLHNE